MKYLILAALVGSVLLVEAAFARAEPAQQTEPAGQKPGGPGAQKPGGSPENKQAEQKEPAKKEEEVRPEEKMRRRLPQPVRVKDLWGMDVINNEDRSYGKVVTVAKSKDGKFQIVIRYGGLLGFGARPLPLPIEALAIIGDRLLVMDIAPEQIAKAPTWSEATSQVLPATDYVMVGIGKH